jgi:prepilin-type N-terminal cleavage/methylation domain-containing protein
MKKVGTNLGLAAAGRTPGSAWGFTLIEMLIVVAVIGILASMIVPITGALDKIKKKTRTKGEREAIVSAIESYKAKLGHYPPDNPAVPFGPYTNQLYYELAGAVYAANANGSLDTTHYLVSDGSTVAVNTFTNAFGPGNVGGIANFTPKVDNEEGSTVVNFIRSGFSPNQFQINPNGVKFLVSTVAWPASMAGNMPPGSVGNYLCWRYNSSNPAHNTGSFDLWVDVLIGGKTNRFCNWARDEFIVGAP